MRDVAPWLRSPNAGPFLELIEFAHALDEVFKHAKALDDVLRNLGFELVALEENDPSDEKRIRQCAERAAGASAHCEQLVIALGQIRDGARGWSELPD